jgi:mannosidase alpha-like ER degradation enhancer 2
MDVFRTLLQKYAFAPEMYNLNTQKMVPGFEANFLRPEVAESYMYLYGATRDPAWLQAGREIVEAIEYSCWVRLHAFAVVMFAD